MVTTDISVSSLQSDLFEEVTQLKTRLDESGVPEGLKEKAENMLRRLVRMAKFGGYAEEYEKLAHWFDWVLSLPWQEETEDILELERAKNIMDKYHHGMEDVKERILEFLSVIKLNKQKNNPISSPILCLVGLVGTGKTSFAYALAETMGRKFSRIPFGGMGSALDLRGQSKLHPDNEPGWIVKALRKAKSRNPVILLDEIDRVAEDARGDIMGVLVEVLDPQQNMFFIDHYIDYPFDLSKVLFVTTCNNTANISTAVLDRMEVIQMPSYSDEEKTIIAKQYLLPRIMKESGLGTENLTIDDSLWPNIVRPLGFDAGMRSLERNLEKICRKVSKLIIEGKGEHFHLNQTNLKEFLPSF